MAKSVPQGESGSTLHLVYEKKTRTVECCVWESPNGRLVALSNDWMFQHQEADIDPIPELMDCYFNGDISAEAEPEDED